MLKLKPKKPQHRDDLWKKIGDHNDLPELLDWMMETIPVAGAAMSLVRRHVCVTGLGCGMGSWAYGRGWNEGRDVMALTPAGYLVTREFGSIVFHADHLCISKNGMLPFEEHMLAHGWPLKTRERWMVEYERARQLQPALLPEKPLPLLKRSNVLVGIGYGDPNFLQRVLDHDPYLYVGELYGS